MPNVDVANNARFIMTGQGTVMRGMPRNVYLTAEILNFITVGYLVQLDNVPANPPPDPTDGGPFSTDEERIAAIAAHNAAGGAHAALKAIADSALSLAQSAPSRSGVLLPTGKHTPLIASGQSLLSAAKDREVVFGFELAPQTIDRISFRLNNTPDAGAQVRVAVRADADGSIGAPVASSVSMQSLDGGPRWISATINRVHPGGVLWIAHVFQNWVTTAPELDGNQGAFFVPFRAVALVSAASYTALADVPTWDAWAAWQDGITGALPSTFVHGTGFAAQGITLLARRTA